MTDLDRSTRLGDLTAEDMTKPIGYSVGTPELLAETLGRLRRANDGLRQAENGEWRGLTPERWCELVRREVAQAAMDVERLLCREGKDR